MELMVEQKYKQTEVGMIPEDWLVNKVGVISDVKTGPFGSALHEKDYVLDGTPIITVEHLGERGVTHENLPLVSDADKKRLSSYLLQEDDIVFSRVGSVDRNSIVTKDEDGWLFSGRLLRVRIKSPQVHAKYLSYCFHHEPTKQKIRSVAVGQTMASLNTQILKEISISLPPTKEEQTAIATALSDADALITGLEKLIAKKRNIKQGAMQELLRPKEGWEVKKLGECLIYEQPTNYLVKDTEYNDNNQTPVLTAGKTFILGYTDEEFGIFRSTPVIIFDDFTTATKYVNFPFKVKSSAMKLLKPKNDSVDLRFIYESMNQIVYVLGGDHKRRWIGEYQHIEIHVPQYEIQVKIAQTIGDMDAEIEALKRKLEKLKEIKQGLMQMLLTGKVRLV